MALETGFFYSLVSIKMKLKDRLFKQGVEAASKVCGTIDTYICPLCGNNFQETHLQTGDLTLEHVPPQSENGKVIILTCKKCNNFTGHSIDAQNAKQQSLNNFLLTSFGKKTGHAGRAVIELNNDKLNVDISNDGEEMKVVAVPGCNNPESVKKFIQHLKHMSREENTSNLKFKVTARAKYHKKQSEISDLKSAFLICAATFGYRFALSTSLIKVRKQILDPDNTHIPDWYFSSEMSQGSANHIYVINEKNIVLVVFGNTNKKIALPWCSNSIDDFSLFSEHIRSGNKVTLNYTEAEWPQSFEARLDHA